MQIQTYMYMYYALYLWKQNFFTIFIKTTRNRYQIIMYCMNSLSFKPIGPTRAFIWCPSKKKKHSIVCWYIHTCTCVHSLYFWVNITNTYLYIWSQENGLRTYTTTKSFKRKIRWLMNEVASLCNWMHCLW